MSNLHDVRARFQRVVGDLPSDNLSLPEVPAVMIPGSRAEALNKAAGFLRSQLSKDSTLRMVPSLRFRFDSSVGQGRYMEDLIERAVASDKHGETDQPDN